MSTKAEFATATRSNNTLTVQNHQSSKAKIGSSILASVAASCSEKVSKKQTIVRLH